MLVYLYAHLGVLREIRRTQLERTRNRVYDSLEANLGSLPLQIQCKTACIVYSLQATWYYKDYSLSLSCFYYYCIRTHHMSSCALRLLIITCIKAESQGRIQYTFDIKRVVINAKFRFFFLFFFFLRYIYYVEEARERRKLEGYIKRVSRKTSLISCT